MDRRFGLCASKFRAGNESRQIPVPSAGFHQYRQDGAVLHREFRADDWTDPPFAACSVKARRAVESVPVQQSHSGHTQFCGAFCELFRERGPAEEAEGTVGVKFDVGHICSKEHYPFEEKCHARESTFRDNSGIK